jgi:hypothetical protein
MTRRTPSHRVIPALLVAALALAACGSDDPDGASSDATVAAPTTTLDPTVTAPPTTTATTDEATTTTAADGTDSGATATTAPSVGWTSYGVEDPACACADASQYWFHTLARDPQRVLLYFQGGGACFNEQMCSFTDGTYKTSTGPDDHPQDGDEGIWDDDNPANPFRDWSVVYVPYCSGDVFLGDAETTYADDLTVQHRGALHARKGLDHVVDEFGDVTELFVTGSSAGGVPAPLIGGLASDLLPGAEITVLSDASGGFPSNTEVNGFIGGLWGIGEHVPDWPELEGVPIEQIGVPDLFTYAGLHDPTIRMARYDNAFDAVQEIFASLANLVGGLPTVLDANEAATESAGVPLDVFVAPGTAHTILGEDQLYELVVEGTAFIDWLTTLVDGRSPGDVRCTDCAGPAG